MSVLPCPGVRACPAPRAPAVRMETRSTIGDRSDERKIDGSSPPVTPPGTDPGTGAGPAASTDGAVATGVTGRDDARAIAPPPQPASGVASATSRAGSVGPPGVTTSETVLSASAWVSRLVGYVRRRSDVVAVRIGTPA